MMNTGDTVILNHDVTAEHLAMDSPDPDEGYGAGDIIGPAGTPVTIVDDEWPATEVDLIEVTGFANDPDASGYIERSWVDTSVLVTVTATCEATLTETWVLRVIPRWADKIIADPGEALDLLGSGATVSVDNTHVGDEGDRTIVSVELTEPKADNDGCAPFYTFPADRWAQREANADRLAEAAVAFLDVDAGESAAWFITHWPLGLVAGADVTACREWLVVKAPYERINAFYDIVSGRGLISSSSGHGDHTNFTPTG